MGREIDTTARGVLSRVAEFLGIKGDSFLAEEFGVTADTIRTWRSRGAIPLEKCRDVSERHKLSLDWMVFGVGYQALPGIDDSNVIRGSHLGAANPDGFTLVPVYNVRVSAGGGALNHHSEVVQHLAFRSDWVVDDLRRDPAFLVVVKVAGDSMSPTLNEDDTLLVDRTEHQLTDGIYVLDINDRMMVKRVQMLADGSVRLMSDNPAYSAEDVRDQELEHLVVVGRVVWIGRRV